MGHAARENFLLPPLRRGWRDDHVVRYVSPLQLLHNPGNHRGQGCDVCRRRLAWRARLATSRHHEARAIPALVNDQLDLRATFRGLARDDRAVHPLDRQLRARQAAIAQVQPVEVEMVHRCEPQQRIEDESEVFPPRLRQQVQTAEHKLLGQHLGPHLLALRHQQHVAGGQRRHIGQNGGAKRPCRVLLRKGLHLANLLGGVHLGEVERVGAHGVHNHLLRYDALPRRPLLTEVLARELRDETQGAGQSAALDGRGAGSDHAPLVQDAVEADQHLVVEVAVPARGQQALCAAVPTARHG
mmetsp:Transcript_92641/g.235530  ORF Transcript_92641/g.235530 Transcript_92641/m.235530 type:complete len:299 (+) Transcript_92641:469-1365(+)